MSRMYQYTCYMYKKADHSLETGDIIKDIEILEDVMKRTKKYL